MVFIFLQALASINLVMASLCYGVSFAFTGTLLPLIREYVDEESETWLGKFLNLNFHQAFSYFANMQSGAT